MTWKAPERLLETGADHLDEELAGVRHFDARIARASIFVRTELGFLGEVEDEVCGRVNRKCIVALVSEKPAHPVPRVAEVEAHFQEGEFFGILDWGAIRAWLMIFGRGSLPRTVGEGEYQSS